MLPPTPDLFTFWERSLTNLSVGGIFLPLCHPFMHDLASQPTEEAFEVRLQMGCPFPPSEVGKAEQPLLGEELAVLRGSPLYHRFFSSFLFPISPPRNPFSS